MDEQQNPPPKRRALRWVLGGSLALNLVFVGLFAGAAMRHLGDDGKKRDGGQVIQNFGAPMARALPSDARRTFRRQLRDEASGLPSRQERRALYGEALAALRADPFDEAKVRSLLSLQSDIAQKVQTYAQDVWVELILEMSAEERLNVADRLEEALSRPRKPRKP